MTTSRSISSSSPAEARLAGDHAAVPAAARRAGVDIGPLASCGLGEGGAGLGGAGP